ncbi:MAG: AAA family ATPase, partial [Mediterranea sp.]|nr:AAA family ATPase [Mediterranea sp.]
MALPTRIFPIGIQSFEDLRTHDYAYVDKTDLVYRMANTNRV